MRKRIHSKASTKKQWKMSWDFVFFCVGSRWPHFALSLTHFLNASWKFFRWWCSWSSLIYVLILNLIIFLTFTFSQLLNLWWRKHGKACGDTRRWIYTSQWIVKAAKFCNLPNSSINAGNNSFEGSRNIINRRKTSERFACFLLTYFIVLAILILHTKNFQLF